MGTLFLLYCWAFIYKNQEIQYNSHGDFLFSVLIP